ncbi:hypothetical protein P8452_48358 [Trifolium repens]|nr:hypothetical protein P8452_48358 [Trifolium repens]
MESLRIGTWSGKAKCIGALLCVGGALVTRLYKGKEFYISHHHAHHAAQTSVVAAHKIHMLRGTFFLIAACFSYTAWFILQAKLMILFPLRYWGTMLSCVMAALQAAIIGVCIDSSKEAWKLEWNLQLITIIYSGALATAATFCLLGTLILGEPLKIGTLVGMVLIILGLYFFLWAKKNETSRSPQTNVAAGELSTSMAIDESFQAQSTGVVTPISSLPNKSVHLEIEKN